MNGDESCDKHTQNGWSTNGYDNHGTSSQSGRSTNHVITARRQRLLNDVDSVINKMKSDKSGDSNERDAGGDDEIIDGLASTLKASALSDIKMISNGYYPSSAANSNSPPNSRISSVNGFENGERSYQYVSIRLGFLSYLLTTYLLEAFLACLCVRSRHNTISFYGLSWLACRSMETNDKK